MPEFENKARFDGVTCIRDSGKALLCRFDNGRERWIPQKAIDDDSSVFAYGHKGQLVIDERFAEKEGLV